MSVWLCIPSARSAEDANPILAKWRDRGYRIALWLDQSDMVTSSFKIGDLSMRGTYPGYAQSVNALTKAVFALDPDCNWVVAGGDDTEPDPNHTADEIARECSAYFAGVHVVDHWSRRRDTLGVMQPTGDRFAGGCIDRICGSPWMGREFCRLINGGRGPLWPEYYHMFVDEELQNVAFKHGILWQRRDLVHLHRHFQRESDALDSRAIDKSRPAFLDEANSPAHWKMYKEIFDARKANGFPGSAW